MSKIPPEIDQMIWTVAEQGNSNAELEFLKRYPLYRGELLKRKAAVSSLKTSNPAMATKPKPVPRFVPREPAIARPAPRLVLAVGLLGLLTLAVASYTVTSMLTPPPLHIEPAPQQIQGPTKVQNSPPEQSKPAPIDLGPAAVAPSNEGAPIPEAPPKYAKTASLIVKKAGLVDVFKLMEAETGMKVVVAPGMPNPTVAVEYHDMTAMEMLQDLSQKYQFTPFDQGDGSVVVYPAVDASAGPGPVRRIGG